MIDAALFSSVRTTPEGQGSSDCWTTPKSVLERVRQVAPIGLDPCTTIDNPTGAHAFFDAEDDGLTRDWICARGKLVFCNPPYASMAEWSAKAIEQILKQKGELIFLCPARTDTRWWHSMLPHIDAVAFWRGRLRFGDATASAPFPSAVLYAGERAKRFRAVFSDVAWVVEP